MSIACTPNEWPFPAAFWRTILTIELKVYFHTQVQQLQEINAVDGPVSAVGCLVAVRQVTSKEALPKHVDKAGLPDVQIMDTIDRA